MHKPTALRVVPPRNDRDWESQPSWQSQQEIEPATEFPQAEPESQVFFTRDQRRSRRKRDVRARTINMSRYAHSALELGRILQPEVETSRPRQRRDCASVPRPCPFVSCRYHLYLDVSPKTGSIKLNFPDLEVEELEHSCALDVAASGPLSAEELGKVMNLTRERVRQIERRSLSSALHCLDASHESTESAMGCGSDADD